MSVKTSEITYGAWTVSATNPNPFQYRDSRPTFIEVETLEANRLIQLLKSHWNTIPTAQILEINRPTAYSRNYRFEVNGSAFFLRESSLITAQAKHALDAFRSFLSERGLPGPNPILTKAGLRFLEDGLTLFSLTREIVGTHYDGRLECLREAGKMLARFHLEAIQFPDVHTIQRTQGAVYDWHLGQWTEIGNRVRHGKSDFDRECRLLLDLVEHLGRFYSEPLLPLPIQVGHFDWNPHNLIFDPLGFEVRAILDFDLVRESQRARDVAIGIHRFCRVFGNRTERGLKDKGTLAERAQEFLQAYESVSPLLSEELGAMKTLLFHETRRKIEYILAKHYLNGDTSSDFDLEKQATLMLELELLGL